MIVFKLERERPAYQIHQNQVFYIKDKIIHIHDLNSDADQEVLSIRKLDSPYVVPRTLSYNPAERAVLVTSVTFSNLLSNYTYTQQLSEKKRIYFNESIYAYIYLYSLMMAVSMNYTIYPKTSLEV